VFAKRLVQPRQSAHLKEFLTVLGVPTKLTKPAKGGFCQFRRVMALVDTRELATTPTLGVSSLYSAFWDDHHA
jgi:hypothetical protein